LVADVSRGDLKPGDRIFVPVFAGRTSDGNKITAVTLNKMDRVPNLTGDAAVDRPDGHH
jgi:hypothetical protein